jgi:hypothetical protein
MYAIYAEDNGYYYFQSAPESLFCSKCDSYIGDNDFFPEKLAIRKLKKNFSYTYDGRLLLSELAVDFFKEFNIENITFKLVNKKPKVYVPIVNSVIKFDVNKSKTRFENLCGLCGNYESIVKYAPNSLFQNEIKLKCHYGIFKTNLSFGSGREKSPLIIAGEKLAKLLKKEFKEIDLHKIHS